MIEYLPWSTHEYERCLDVYLKGNLSILDIELGGQCNYHCIYCDSPNREKKCMVSISQVEKLFQEFPIKWVFVCGLGEPTVQGNLEILLGILKLCERYEAKCSIFTNLSTLSSAIEEYVKKGILNILFKYDSSDIVKAIRLYGAPNVNKQIYNIEKIKKYVRMKDDKTNIAASIVPTKVNKDEIVSIVKDCLNHGIFPLIAELEDSGEAHEYYSQLALSEEELTQIKNAVNEIIQEEYRVPVCPAVICGIHIRYDGKVTVDEYTGLSCHWFWLQEPKTYVVGDFNTEKVSELIGKIECYRQKQYTNIQNVLVQKSHFVFGGCGGDAITLLQNYVEVYERRHQK